MATRKSIIATGSGGQRAIRGVLTDYQAFVGVAQREMKRIMQEVADEVMKHTMPWVPYEYGSLRESGRAFAEKSDRGYRAVVTFGGDAEVVPSPNAPMGYVDYALIVHEATGTQFRVGSAKYLEIGATEAKPKVDRLIVRELKKLRPGRK